MTITINVLWVLIECGVAEHARRCRLCWQRTNRLFDYGRENPDGGRGWGLEKNENFTHSPSLQYRSRTISSSDLLAGPRCFDLGLISGRSYLNTSRRRQRYCVYKSSSTYQLLRARVRMSYTARTYHLFWHRTAPSRTYITCNANVTARSLSRL